MSDKQKIKHTWKDAHRYYWRVTVWQSGETTSGDYEWAYTISRSDDDVAWTEIYHSSIDGQSDEPAKLSNILLDFQSYINLAMFDGVQFARKD